MEEYMKREDVRDNYELGHSLGEYLAMLCRGNFAQVVIGTFKEDGQTVAIKIMKKPKDSTVDYTQNFLKNEVEILFKVDTYATQLQHDNIIEIYEVYDNPDAFYIIMEYMEGKDLFERIIKQNIRDECVIAKIMKTVSEALEFCHNNNVVHRDLKPQNILLSTMDYTAVIKIADFGLARIVGDDLMTTACGTPSYLAPEIASGKAYNYKADLWSLGILMFHLLTGEPPVKGQEKDVMLYLASGKINLDDPKLTNVSNSAKDLLSRLLKVEPTERYSATDVLNHPWIKCGGKVGMEIYK